MTPLGDGAGEAAAARSEGPASAARPEGPAAAARPAAAPNCSFFKKPAVKGKNIRKRTMEDDDEDEDQQGSAVVQKRKNLKKGALSRGTSRASAEEEQVRTGFVYESSRDVQTYSDSNATATVETETEFDKDARSLREKRLRNAAEAVKKGEEDDGPGTRAGSGPSVYKGMNNYTDHLAGLRRENTISSEKAGGAHGPLRGSQHIRMSIRIDYQPDVCKDYKETGYCGYGDSCKFLHDRGDYKSGWQLEKDWEEQQKAKKERQRLGLSEDGDKDDEDDEELPFACFICREPFTDPVVTKCKHYYCEKCALKHYTKNKNCFVCNKPTFGIFNTAHDILKRARA